MNLVNILLEWKSFGKCGVSIKLQKYDFSGNDQFRIVLSSEVVPIACLFIQNYNIDILAIIIPSNLKFKSIDIERVQVIAPYQQPHRPNGMFSFLKGFLGLMKFT